MNLSILLLLFLVLYSANCLRTEDQGNLPIYQKKDLSTKLQSIQDKFIQSLLKIKEEISKVNSILSDTQTSQKLKLVKMEEGMADERDSLYTIQQYLKIPFSLKVCECKSIKEEVNLELNEKIVSISDDLKKLRQTLTACGQQKCRRYRQLSLQLNSLQNYLKILDETVNSNCCKKSKQLPKENPIGIVDIAKSMKKDNLQAKNWFYGNISILDFQYKRFQMATKYNLTSCPLDSPYVNLQGNQCFQCQEGAKFSFTTRKCILCQKNKFLNEQTSSCDSCRKNEFFNKNSKKCEECSKGQYLNLETGECQGCKKDEYYNLAASECSKCEKEKYFDIQKGQCVYCNLRKGQYLNKETFQCQLCPYGKYYSLDEEKCLNCPFSQYYNNILEKCTHCPQGKKFNDQTGQCTGCKELQFYDKETKQCYECPSGQVYQKNINKCVDSAVEAEKKCPETTPYYNKHTNQCNKCRAHYHYDENTKICVQNNYISRCPPERPVYNLQKLICEPQQ